MEIIQKEVRLDDPIMVFDIIEQVLSKQMSTQIYVANDLFNELYSNGEQYNVFHSNLVVTSHYNNSEKWLNHRKNGLTIHLASFIHNCNTHMQLVQFKTDKITYTHFNEGLKQLLIIEVEK